MLRFALVVVLIGCSSSAEPARPQHRTGDFGRWSVVVPDPDPAVTYDDAGHVIAVRDPDGSVTETVYDLAGNIVAIIEPDGDTTTYLRDADGRVVRSIDPTGGATDYVYDPRGNLVRVTDADGTVTTYTYDADDHWLAWK